MNDNGISSIFKKVAISGITGLQGMVSIGQLSFEHRFSLFERGDVMHDGHDKGFPVTMTQHGCGYAQGTFGPVGAGYLPRFCFQIGPFPHLGHARNGLGSNIRVRIDTLIPAFAVDFFQVVATQIDHALIPEGEMYKGKFIDGVAQTNPVISVFYVSQSKYF